MLVSNMFRELDISPHGGGWLDAGLGHWHEYARFDRSVQYCIEEANALDNFSNGVWRAAIRKMCERAASKGGTLLPPLFNKTTTSMSAPEQAICWSFYDWLVAEHPSALRPILMGLKQKADARELLKEHLGMGLLKAEEAWREGSGHLPQGRPLKERGSDEDLAAPPDLVDGATRLRAVRPGDAEALFPSVHDAPEVTRWLAGTVHRSGAGAKAPAPASWGVFVMAVEEVPGGGSRGGDPALRRAPGVEISVTGSGQLPRKGHGGRAIGLALRLASSRGARRDRERQGQRRVPAVLDRAGFVRNRAPRAASIARSGDSAGAPAGEGAGPPIAWIASLTRRSWTRARRGGAAAP